jgi:multidrug efflux pump subunit AcrB
MNLAATCVKRPVFAVMLIGFLVVLGLFSFRDLGVDLFPKADPATVNINARLPGASSEEVTTQVVIPIEEAISTISGLDEITVMTFESTARITVRFVLERDIESAAQDVREKISGAMRTLPPNLLPLVIQKADPDADPVMSIVVAGGTSLRETSELAEKRVKRALETVQGVGGVSLIGNRERQIRVFVDADKLNAHGLTIDDLQRALQNENVEVPGGRIVRGEVELGVRTLGRIGAVSQFSDIIVSHVRGTPVRVSDLGRVEDTFAEPRTWNMLDDKEAVTLEVRRQSGTNTVQVIEEVKRELDRLRRSLPPGIELRVTKDQSVFINASVTALQEHLLLGSLLASLIVWVFIRSARSVFIAALAIPTSIIATFTLMKALGFTLNNMTLLALTLAVGIVIDDAIVVLENIVRYIEDKEVEPRRAAIEATAEISLAVLATTVSLIIIFVPIAFITGYARRYLNEFGWTMACAVAVSMLVSFTLTPMMSSRLLRRIERKRGGAPPADTPSHHAPSSGFYGRVEGAYTRLLDWSLDHRGAVLAVGLLTFALTFPLNRMVGRDWIPLDDQGEVELSYNMPEGTSIYRTARVSTELAQKFRKIPGVAFVRPYIHDGQMSHSHIYLKLAEFGERSATVHDVANDMRKIVAEYPNLRGRIIFPSALGGGENFYPIRAQILGSDFGTVAEIAKKVADRSRKIPGLYDVDAGLSLNSPELQVRIDRQRAADLGIRAADVANAVRLMIAGEDQISTYRKETSSIPSRCSSSPSSSGTPRSSLV